MNEPRFKIKTLEEKNDYGRFAIEPLEQGYGHTIGNALRRVLLTSLPGAAVVSVKIDGVRHQFQTLSGLKEDIIQLILNLKKLQVKITEEKEGILTLNAKGQGEITAADIECPSNVEIINKDLVLANLTDKSTKLNIEIKVQKGYGYQLADEQEIKEVGLIPIDASFTPIPRVNYTVEATRVGRMTNFDKLLLEIWTDGTIKSSEALKEAAKILTSCFMQIYEPKALDEENTTVAVTPTVSDEILKMTIEELDLPTRIFNALRNGNIETVGQLLGTPKKDLIKIKNLGAKSVSLVEDKLREKGVAISV